MQSQLSNCFNQYDIRGLVGKELNQEAAYQLGRLFAPKTIVIAKDARLSSRELLESFKKALLDSGCYVIELEGISTSPLLYFASSYFKTDGAVMITGSHNGLEYNGFKLMKDNKPFYGNELKQILNSKFTDGKGDFIIKDCYHKYARALSKNIKINKKFTIAWECNNSGIARIIKFLDLPGKHFLLNTELDGNFAHIPPDPMVEENLDQIKALIMEKSCDLGFAFDGDGDRLRMVKTDGKSLTSDQLFYLLALALKTDEMDKVIVDVKTSQVLIDRLIKDGFEVIMAPGGHSIMKDAIIKENALLAGEASGHFIINDGKYFPFDDALYIALRIIEYLQYNSFKELPLASIRKEFKINVSPKEKSEFIEKLKEYNDGMQTLGAVRKNHLNGWWLIRASNTENYILVKYEADNEDVANNIIQEISKIINIRLSLDSI